MKGWSSLGVVDTIYEEEDDDDIEELISPSISSPSLSSPWAFTPLHSRIEAWTVAIGREPNALIRVCGTHFRLHKEPLTSRSSKLKRQLTACSDVTLSPPLNITADTFRLVAEFCYGARIIITPFNIAALRTAAELLEMTDGDGDGADDLRLVSEANFRRFLTGNREHVSVLFRTSLDLLPESETAASCVSRCAEVLSEMMEDDDEIHSSYLADIVKVGIEDFQIMVESMQIRLSNHDFVYRMVDIYLQEHGGKLAEEGKSQICSSVDCTKLSPDLLIHAVQNPKMPLRFAIRAMLVEQLRNRHTFLRATTERGGRRPKQPLMAATAKISDVPAADESTLGGILHRDAAVRQAVQLRATMASTRSRIQSLEAELSGMKRLLNDSGDRAVAELESNSKSVLDSGRSMSFHYGSLESSKIERGERRSASSLSCRFRDEYRGGEEVLALAETTETETETPRGVRKSLRQRFITGLKLAFGVSQKSVSDNKVSKGDAGIKI